MPRQPFHTPARALCRRDLRTRLVPGSCSAAATEVAAAAAAAPAFPRPPRCMNCHRRFSFRPAAAAAVAARARGRAAPSWSG
eukprot:365074-Chlamydomonas_euryale.AAC.3